MFENAVQALRSSQKGLPALRARCRTPRRVTSHHAERSEMDTRPKRAGML